jgi:hypothetical protein
LTLESTDFLGVASADLRTTGLRLGAFFGVRCFGAAFFLTAVFFGALLFKDTLALAVFRAAVFCATALFAFGREVFGLAARRLVAALGEDRGEAVREFERLRLLVTALIS